MIDPMLDPTAGRHLLGELPPRKAPGFANRETPAEKWLGCDGPAEGLSASKPPTEGSPTEEPPASKVPADDSPGFEVPGSEPPADESPGLSERVPASGLPGLSERVPGSEVPACDPPADESPGLSERVPGFEVPGSGPPAGEIPLERVEAALTEGAAHMAAALCRWLASLAEFDRRGGWASWGCRSAAHWLTFRCGVDLYAAREQVKVASRLEDLPAIRHAFSQGELSWWQVRQLVRVAAPGTEPSLLALARAATTPQLAAIVAGLRQVLAQEADLHPRRQLRYHLDEDGFLVLSGRLPPAEGALVARALDAITDDLLRNKRERARRGGAHLPDPPEDPPGDADDLFGATRADALVRMARLALAHGSPEIRDRAQVVVHVDHAVLAGRPVHLPAHHDGQVRGPAAHDANQAAGPAASAAHPASVCPGGPRPEPAHAGSDDGIEPSDGPDSLRPAGHVQGPVATRDPDPPADAARPDGPRPEPAAHPGSDNGIQPSDEPRLAHDGPSSGSPGEPSSAYSADQVGGPRPAHGTEPPRDPSPAHDAKQWTGRCELEGGWPIPAGTALRLACDAALVTVVEDQRGTPLDVGRKTRSISPALRRALRARDGGCRFPGCTETRFVEGHHLVHWAHGGETSLANTAELCHFHHGLVHEGGWRIEGTPPDLRFLRPDGTLLQRPPPGGPCNGDLEGANRGEGLDIDHDTIVSGWRGERLRLGYVVSCVVGSPEWRQEWKQSVAARAGP